MSEEISTDSAMVKGVSMSPSKMPIIVGVAAVVLILLGAGSAYAYYSATAPEKITAKMMKAFSGIKSSEWTGDFKVEMTTLKNAANAGELEAIAPEAPSMVTAEFKLNGGADEHDSNSLKAYFDLDGSFKGLPIGDFSIGLAGRTLGTTTYLRLTKSPNLAMINAFFDLKKIENKWISASMKDAKGVQSMVGIDAADVATGSSTDRQLTKEQEERIRQEVQNRRFLKLTKKLGTETIEGVSTQHFQYELDKAETVLFVKNVYEIVEEKAMPAQDVADLERDLSEIVSFFGEACIGKSDSLLYRLTVNVDFRNEAEKSSGKVTATLNFKNYNKPLTIEVPAGAQSIESLMSEVMGNLLGGSAINTPEDTGALFNKSSLEELESLKIPEMSDLQGDASAQDIDINALIPGLDIPEMPQ